MKYKIWQVLSYDGRGKIPLPFKEPFECPDMFVTPDGKIFRNFGDNVIVEMDSKYFKVEILEE